MYTTSTQRFVREYANFEIRILKDLNKTYPAQRQRNNEIIARINAVVKAWDRGNITAREAMQTISTNCR